MPYTRKMSDFTKQKISDSVKKSWSEKSEIEKQRIAQKKSETMKILWGRIGKGDDGASQTN